ncbi:MAG: 3-dehydroquinate synthase, partial [Proteobacteria bacterium]|nr:3-dehydroquinate synthase [Pseudomonadota bacterium]
MREIEQSFSVRYSYPVAFTRDALSPENDTLLQVLRRAGPQRHRVLPAIDSGLLAANPDLPKRLHRYAEAHPEAMELVAPPLVIRGGEICKSEPREVDQLYTLMARHGICRHSFVLALGGGSVLDAAGLAAASAHRGVRLIRMPSTVLAQNDAGIGVKTAINFAGRKNFVGAFAPPFAVINDLDLLDTLPERDQRSGIAEAVKVALIRDAGFFDLLHRNRAGLAAFEPELMENMILRCAELHLEHIRSGGDPFEFGSARPLDFGHWAAHKLEEISEGELRHGEAVAIGIALDSLYCRRTARITKEELERVLETLEGLGFSLPDPALRRLDVPRALADF